MSKLIKFEVQKFPASRLIGKQVNLSLNPGSENLAPALWQTMWQDGSMEFLKNLPGRSTPDPDTVGWMGDYDPETNSFVYIAGVLAKEGYIVPDGFVYRDIPQCDMGIGWIQGREEGADLYAGAHNHVAEAMKESGYEYDSSSGDFEMEYYSYKRFAVPHYIGEKILIMDYYSPCRKIVTGEGDTPAEKVISMEVDSKIKKNFDSLPQRIIYAYMCTYPDCITVEDDKVSEKSQKHMHSFLHNAICSIYNNPSLINLEVEPDDFFENWEMCNRRPELIDSMRKIEKTLFDFYLYLYKLGEIGEVKDNRLYVSKEKLKILQKRRIQLEQFGLLSETDKDSAIFYSEKYPELFPAWKLLYNIKLDSSKHEIARFLYCMYDIKQYNAVHLFGDITENRELIGELEDYFRNKEYQCSFNEHGITWERDYPDKQRGYMTLSFDWKRRDQMTYTFHVPSFRLLLNHFDIMDDELKNLAFSRTKKCDGCGYCTQTDKTGKRKPLVMLIEYNGQKVGKCPLYPNLTWRYIDKKEVKVIKKLYDFGETVLT